jgi:hypothetical protein
MSPKTISRAAIGGYLKLLRLPLDAAAGILDRSGNGRPSGTQVALDRIEARLRGAAGRTLGDEQLVEDAERRRLAADERARARRLHDDADRQSEQGRDAARRTAERKRRAEQKRQAETRQIEEAEERRRRAVKDAAARREDAIEDRSKRARLGQLDEEAAALSKEQEALTARDESQRLRRAATKAKAQRKRSSD